MAENLPAVPGDDLDEVVDGVVVDEPEAPAQRPAVYELNVINIVVKHPVPRATARHALYVPGGMVALARQWRRRRNLATAMAEATGPANGPLALQFLQQAELERKQRAERMRARAETFRDLVHLSPYLLAIWVFLMVMTGICLAWAHHSAGDFLWPWRTLADFVSDLVAAAAVMVWVVAIGVPAGFVAWLWHLGRTAELAPNWARTAGDDDVDHEVTELLLTNALANLRLPQVRDYLKLGQPLQFITGCRQEGRGTFAAIRLPGVPAERVVRRRADLAAGVHRAAKEVWPKTGSEAAILEVWIADKGALEEGAGAYPLLDEGFTNVFKGLPFGRTLRGDPTSIPVIGRNSISGGAPDQGKSNGARVVAAGYTLDVVTELRLYIPDANFDFERFKPRTSSYLMGAEDEVIEGILGELEVLKEEIQRRGRLLIEAEAEEVTYDLAHAGIGLHPVFVLLEEAHVVIQHPKHGKAFKQLLPEIVKLDRKRGIHVMVSTQAPTKDSMPRDVTRNCTVGIAYAVGDHVANDALLGQGAYAAGHRATELIPGTDRGTALVKGFAGEARSEMVQAYRVSGRSGDDQVTPLVERAMSALAEQGRAVPGTNRSLAIVSSRDLLDDLAKVLEHRSGKVRVSELPDLLHNLAASWGPYRSLTGVQLRRQLMELGVPTTNPGNVPTLDLDDLHRARAEREVS